jgi:broad specificity phosphatase PhoE
MGQLLLVRHGQASWGADDYDVLSGAGHEQSALLGKFLAERGIVADLLVTGGMRRHRETAEEMFPGAEPVLDPGWDEFDHVAMLAKLPAPFEGRKPTKEEFQAWFEEATDRWTGGAHDDYAESFAAFTARVDDVARRTTERVAGGTAVVVTSGGPVSWTVAALLGADLDPVDRVRLWRRLNPVCVNSGVTRLVTGRRGTTLVTFNEHAHLDGTDLLTYR